MHLKHTARSRFLSMRVSPSMCRHGQYLTHLKSVSSQEPPLRKPKGSGVGVEVRRDPSWLLLSQAYFHPRGSVSCPFCLRCFCPGIPTVHSQVICPVLKNYCSVRPLMTALSKPAPPGTSALLPFFNLSL